MPRISAATFSKIAAALCLLVLASSLYFLFSIRSAHQAATEGLQRIDRIHRTVTTAREAQVSFKNQIQEWKNILLRGQNPDDFTRYRTAFESAEAATRVKLDELARHFTEAGLDDAPAHFPAAHGRLAELYRQGLQAYDTSNPASIFQVDALVRGIDRQLNNEIDALALATEHRAEILATSIQNEATRRRQAHTLTSWILGGVTVLAVLSFATLAVLRKP
ncbi:MAG: hypothetical protein SNJ84_09300 [Verrucomicrobiia bacterium]